MNVKGKQKLRAHTSNDKNFKKFKANILHKIIEENNTMVSIQNARDIHNRELFYKAHNSDSYSKIGNVKNVRKNQSYIQSGNEYISKKEIYIRKNGSGPIPKRIRHVVLFTHKHRTNSILKGYGLKGGVENGDVAMIAFKNDGTPYDFQIM